MSNRGIPTASVHASGSTFLFVGEENVPFGNLADYIVYSQNTAFSRQWVSSKLRERLTQSGL